MKEENIITVLTPTYNRCKELQQLYYSLLVQSDKSFVWMIVDDGSTDDTENMVDNWKQNGSLQITYIKQENKGKHCALNYGVKQVKTPLVFIVDSDDVLTQDAILTISDDVRNNVLEDETICGIGYLRGSTESSVIGQEYSQDYFISDFITERFYIGTQGDKAEVWKTDDLRTVPFPEFEGEHFFGEGYVWCTLAKKKRMLFVNKIIYITEYLDGGLSKSGRKLRIHCPKGGMANAEVMMGSEFNLKNRIKGSLLYIAYGKFDNVSFLAMLKKNGCPWLIVLCYFPGVILHCFWKMKYDK